MGEWRCQSGVVLTKICDVYLLISDREAMKECAYVRQVNEIGAFIWERLSKGMSVSDILSFLRAEYDIPVEFNLEEDVDKFLCALSEGHYIFDEKMYCVATLQTEDGSTQ